MHHRQAATKDVHTREAALFEDAGAAFRFEKGKTREHDHARAKIERMGNELTDDLKRRIRQEALDTDRHRRRHQKIGDKVQREPIVMNVAGDHRVSAITQHTNNGAAPGSGLPYPMWQLLDLQ